MKKQLLLIMAFFAINFIQAQQVKQFTPGEVWNDTDGHFIQAHGGGIMSLDGTWYWYGENKDAPNNQSEGKNPQRVDVIGISCYSSTDLYNWKFEGVVLPAVKDNPAHDLHPSRVVERPKVIFNENTGKFIMLMHIDKADYGYARIGFAVSDKPTGPFEYKYSVSPGGCDSRDMTVFKDDNGKAYIFYSSEWNKTMHVMQLSDDYLQPVGDIHRIFIGLSREAPAVFKFNGKYYIITSGCTGWAPNVADCSVADSIMGIWKSIGNPCIGKDSQITYYGQSTFILQMPGEKNQFIFIADRWNPQNLRDSRYLWLPLEVDESGKVKITWQEQWLWQDKSGKKLRN
jgi:beta-galactosidase